MKIIIQGEEYKLGDTFQVVKSDGITVSSTIYSLTGIRKIKEEEVVLCTFKVNQGEEIFIQENYFPIINTSIRKCLN